METTTGTLLGGRVIYHQPLNGYRTGIEPVLLAATVPACAGQRVMEGGAGAGAGLLCLAARVPGVRGLGVERDPGLASLAARNIAANGLADLCVTMADLVQFAAGPPIDHAMANPPWHDEAGPASADPGRDAAKRGQPGLIAAWAQALGRRLVHRGTLTLILPAHALAEGLAALEAAGCGTLALLPLWPAADRAARIIIVQGVRGGRGGARVLPGMALHEPGAGYTPAAQGVLREGLALPL